MDFYSSELYSARLESRRRSLAVVGALGKRLIIVDFIALINDPIDLDMDGCLHDAPDNDIPLEEVEPIVPEDATR